jgi:Skp family chaperone for outer membrane proteins
MRPMRLLLPVILLAALVMAPFAAAADDQGDAPRIAVLRLNDAMVGFKFYVAGMQKIKVEVAAGEGKLHAMEQRIDQLQTMMQSLNPENEAYAKSELECEQTKAAFKVLLNRGQAEINAKHMAVIKDSFTRLHAVLADYCKEKGIKLVHLAPNPDLDGQNGTDQNLAEVTNELFMQDVLYFDPSYDITNSFVAYLNAHVPADAAPDVAGASATAATASAPASAAAPAGP